jgi:hypothetical protein
MVMVSQSNRSHNLSGRNGPYVIRLGAPLSAEQITQNVTARLDYVCEAESKIQLLAHFGTLVPIMSNFWAGYIWVADYDC